MPGATGDITRVLRARPEAAGEARRAIVSLPLAGDARERLALLVSELVTNSVRHARLSSDDAITLRITSRDGLIRIAVRDTGAGFAPSSLDLDGGGPGDVGHGLQVVDDVADAWGADRDSEGFTVWCEVATNAAPPAEQQLSAG